MVNTGKPSRGCYMCRARRIKCDEGKPSCLRCQKSKRICPGYRDPSDLKLRNEAKASKKKAARQSSQAQPELHEEIYSYDAPYSSSNSSSSPEYTWSGHSRQDSVESISDSSWQVNKRRASIKPPPSTPVIQQAACYFLTELVLVPEEGTMRGYFDFIVPLLRTKTAGSALWLAFSAAALASFGSRPNSKALLPQADLWYVQALKELNSALKDPSIAASDSTLASIMLMSSFEQHVPSRNKPAGWASHVEGAVTMIKSRPIEQWDDPVSRDLFIAVRALMTIRCIIQSTRADPDIDWMMVTSDDITNRFAAVNLKMAELRADNEVTTDLRDRNSTNVDKVVSLLWRAEALDLEYLEWIRVLPPTWSITTVAWIEELPLNLEESLVHPGRVDAYGELWMAYKYNFVRACRIFIQSTIIRCIAWLGGSNEYRMTPEYATAASICSELIEDIVASVPYFFGWNRDRNPAMADRSNFACGTNDNTEMKRVSAVFAMWPLFAASTSDFTSPSQRIFLRSRLKFIAETMGINQALLMYHSKLFHPSLLVYKDKGLTLSPRAPVVVPLPTKSAMSPVSKPGQNAITKSFGNAEFLEDTQNINLQDHQQQWKAAWIVPESTDSPIPRFENT